MAALICSQTEFDEESVTIKARNKQCHELFACHSLKSSLK